MTDAELLTRYVREHDQSAFAGIVARHARLVFAAARRLAPRDADDVAQATFLLLAQRAGRLLDRRSLAGWLYETTRRCAGNARRMRDRHDARLRAIAATPPARPATSGDVELILDAALDRLPRAMRDVVLLRHLESLSVAETAERLGVPMTTVTKRGERGLTKLRDYFAARGHASLGVAGVATALATIAASSAPADANVIAAAATSKSVAPSVAALAKTASPLPLIGAAAAVIAVAAAAVAVRVDRPTRIAAAAAPSAVVATTAAATLPAGVTQAAAQIVGDAFLHRLRDRDAAGIAALLAPDAAVDAADVIRALRDGEYARFPQRLTLGGGSMFQQEPTVFGADGARQPPSPGGPRLISATLEVQAPIEADIGRAVLTLRVVGDAWRVTSARFVADGAVDAGRRVDLGGAAATTMPVDLATARSAIDAWTAADVANGSLPQPDTMTDADVPRFRAALEATASAAAGLSRVLAKTPLALKDDDVAAIARTIDEMRREIDRAPTRATIVAVERDDSRLAPVRGAFGRIEATIATLKAGLDAADEAKPTTPRPASFGPPVTLRLAWLNDRPVRLRGPLTMPAWLGETRAWKQWERQHDIKTFRTRDDAGNAYEVAIAGAKKDADGATVPILQSVRQYRADGTLAAVAEYGWDDFANSWGEFDSSGRRYTFRAVARRGEKGTEPYVYYVRFYDAAGTIRTWQMRVNQRDVVWCENVQDPLGANERTIHLVHKNGSDDGDPADDLPIAELPLVGE